jgi:quercetin dioxygenase-like cupin family protein
VDAGRLPPHRHRNEAETIHVVEGDFEMEVDGRRSRVSPGQTIHVPAGVTHSSSNAGPQAGRRILLFSPAGMERFFLEAGARGPGGELDAADTLVFATRHGWEFTPR